MILLKKSSICYKIVIIHFLIFLIRTEVIKFVYISTNASNEIELAYLDDISSSATTIELIPTEVKLDEYVKSSSYSLRTAIVNRQIIKKNIDIHINTKFKVSANL